MPIPDIELFDDDGYPTDAALDAIIAFTGTPAELIALIRGLWYLDGHGMDVEEITDNGETRHVIRFVTGGWSGNESVLAALDNTMFHHLCWQLSERGGLEIYSVSHQFWNMEFNWGRPSPDVARQRRQVTEILGEFFTPDGLPKTVANLRPEELKYSREGDWRTFTERREGIWQIRLEAAADKLLHFDGR